jgi:hypothetical protein
MRSAGEEYPTIDDVKARHRRHDAKPRVAEAMMISFDLHTSWCHLSAHLENSLPFLIARIFAMRRWGPAVHRDTGRRQSTSADRHRCGRHARRSARQDATGSSSDPDPGDHDPSGVGHH